MQPTLPLFDDPPSEAVQTAPRVDSRAAGAGQRSEGVPPAESHLLAARRLARQIRRLPERSAAQTRLGLAICSHLQALLAESSGER